MFSPFVIALALNAFFGTAECEMHYRLMESETWYLLDDSGIDGASATHITQEVDNGEGKEGT